MASKRRTRRGTTPDLSTTVQDAMLIAHGRPNRRNRARLTAARLADSARVTAALFGTETLAGVA